MILWTKINLQTRHPLLWLAMFQTWAVLQMAKIPVDHQVIISDGSGTRNPGFGSAWEKWGYGKLNMQGVCSVICQIFRLILVFWRVGRFCPKPVFSGFGSSWRKMGNFCIREAGGSKSNFRPPALLSLNKISSLGTPFPEQTLLPTYIIWWSRNRIEVL